MAASARWRGGSRSTRAGSSDPCAFLNLDGEKRKSRVVKKNINPQWMQTFRFPCDDGLNVTLQCDIEDYDLKGNDFMGRYLGVLKRCGAFYATRGHLTSMRVASFSNLSCFGPRLGVSERQRSRRWRHETAPAATPSS